MVWKKSSCESWDSWRGRGPEMDGTDQRQVARLTSWPTAHSQMRRPRGKGVRNNVQRSVRYKRKRDTGDSRCVGQVPVRELVPMLTYARLLSWPMHVGIVPLILELPRLSHVSCCNPHSCEGRCRDGEVGSSRAIAAVRILFGPRSTPRGRAGDREAKLSH